MKFWCCFSSPDLTEPLPMSREGIQPRPQPQPTSSTYIVPDNMKCNSELLHHQDSELTQDQSHGEIPAPERSRHKSSMSSPQQDAHDNSDEELRTTGKSTAQWKDEEKTKGSAHSQAVIAGEEWRRWKDNPACKDYTILNTLGRGAFADVRYLHPRLLSFESLHLSSTVSGGFLRFSRGPSGVAVPRLKLANCCVRCDTGAEDA
jgi:hypothetical protein